MLTIHFGVSYMIWINLWGCVSLSIQFGKLFLLIRTVAKIVSSIN